MPFTATARRPLLLAAALLCALQAPARAATTQVYLEAMTSPELRQRLAEGATTVLVPIGGTEQNGPHMALGKHNVRATRLAGEIARELGDAVVAPVIAYVPEGAVHPPAAHMRFAGTISVPEPVFEGLLEAAARSFRQHGFRQVVFLGDHGGYQRSEQHVATKLNREWEHDATCRVQALTAYYDAAQSGFAKALQDRGFATGEIGTHAGLADTSLTLAVAPELVRAEKLAEAARAGAREGVHGDPRRASAELGLIGTRRIVEVSVAAIRAARHAH